MGPGDDERDDVDALPVPPPPRERDATGDGSPPPGYDVDLCWFCQRPRSVPASGSGRRSRFCDTVWAQYRGKSVTCQRLDDTLGLWTAVYGGAHPLGQLDLAVIHRHVDTLLKALDPMRHDLGRLDEQLRREVAESRTAVADARLAAELAEGRALRADDARALAEEDKRAALEIAGQAEQKATVAVADAEAARAERNTAVTERNAEAEGRARADELARSMQDALRETEAQHVQAVEAAATLRTTLIERDTALTTATTRITALEAELRGAYETHRRELREQTDQLRQDADARDTAREDRHERVLARIAEETTRRTAEAEQRHAEQTTQLNRRIADLDEQLRHADTTTTQARSAADDAVSARDGVQRRHARLREDLLVFAAEPDVADVRERLTRILQSDADDSETGPLAQSGDR